MFGLFKPTDKQVVRRYVACLNARDLDGISVLLHPNCRFIDSHGEWIEGREAIIKATTRFFTLERKFKLKLEALVEHDGEILMRGTTSAERAEFRNDALWKSRVKDRLIIYWQSFGPQSSPRLARILRGDADLAESESPLDGGKLLPARDALTLFSIYLARLRHFT